MRFVTWNMGRLARTHDAAWHYLLSHVKPDIAFVQEVLKSADGLCRDHGSLVRSRSPRSGTAVFVRRGIEFEPFDTSLDGSYVAAITTPVLGADARAVSVHVGPENWENQVALREWLVNELLPKGRCIIGGDLNTSRTLSRRHAEFLESLSANGFHDCHWSLHKTERPSFWGRQAATEYQDDHFFADSSLAQFVRACDVVDNPVTLSSVTTVQSRSTWRSSNLWP